MYIGIDLGTSRVKVVLLDENQNYCHYSKSLPISRPQPLWSEQKIHKIGGMPPRSNA